ncbi:MAG TPA: alpha/beta hydrolase [Puia sp.]|uniref:alpha/beta hydrolase n=1 Tax=Puia sp. TaxID=2045100 RepID=UPI002B5FFCBC|nr:alpha/beta hydrolase [Puia sp.]HVU95561.1 alpha/beta hydrolase [Puia sp.]
MDCYCISGLGADERILSRLELPGVRLRPLPWLMPASTHEPFDDYADRMRAGIGSLWPEATDLGAAGEPTVLMGVSFGGMMAIEIAKKIPGARVILVSSVRDHLQIPFWIRIGGRVYPRWLDPRVKAPRRLMGFAEDYFIGVESAEDRRLVSDFQNKVDRQFLYWAIQTIARWQNEWAPRCCYHIHGGRDRMFPIRKVQPTHIIPDGGHLMVYNRAEAVSSVLREILG